MEGFINSYEPEAFSMGRNPRQVEAFETKDGQLFRSRQDANIHHLRLTFEEWYNENQILYDSIDGRTLGINANTIFGWAEENIAGLLPLIKAIHSQIMGEEE